MSVFQSMLGIVTFIGVAWLLSEQRRQFPVRVVVSGVLLQFVLAVLLLKLPPFKEFFLLLNEMLLALETATRAGTSFVFGYLGGGPLPFETSHPGADFILAFRALPLILVISALSALLFYWRILPWVVRGFAWGLEKIMGVGGAVGLGAASNIFIGMTEAPLFIRPYLATMSRAELFALMTTGMATIAGTMMVLYGSILSSVSAEAMGHILTASIISAPAALLVALVMVPGVQQVRDEAAKRFEVKSPAESAMDAVTRGTLEGVQLLLNIIAMLVVLVALVSLVNAALGWLPAVGGEAISLQRMLGYLMAPVVWLMGIPWSESMVAGGLMGVKTILNEFIAYLQLSQLPVGALSERSEIIMIYALCGFANIGSIGILIGGLATLVPERRVEVVRLGAKSVIAGTLATLMTGAVVGVLI
ncbi:MAG: nucleoside:proton symporter [Gammaproteobacteria bacterium]|nr:nucleoside:proton symporter [Gammaproteobacteria bacterium]